MEDYVTRIQGKSVNSWGTLTETWGKNDEKQKCNKKYILESHKIWKHMNMLSTKYIPITEEDTKLCMYPNTWTHLSTQNKEKKKH